jgi:hypothetical protein
MEPVRCNALLPLSSAMGFVFLVPLTAKLAAVRATAPSVSILLSF